MPTRSAGLAQLVDSLRGVTEFDPILEEELADLDADDGEPAPDQLERAAGGATSEVLGFSGA